MACAGTACGSGVGRGGGVGSLSLRQGDVGVSLGVPHRNARSVSSLPVRSRRSRDLLFAGRISMSAATAMASPGLKPERKVGFRENGNGTTGGVATREKVDEWMRDSVAEIVKNLKESPLLVQVYAENDGAVRTTTETAADWPVVKRRWENCEAQLPEGVIFVEQLDDETEAAGIDTTEKDRDFGDGGWRGGTTRAWGIVAQRRGADCGPVCYLLKTSRVGSGSTSGAGMWCTHFCLVKVKSFRETTKSQLQNCWLLQGGQ